MVDGEWKNGFGTSLAFLIRIPAQEILSPGIQPWLFKLRPLSLRLFSGIQV
jgi:hypothetical protein